MWSPVTMDTMLTIGAIARRSGVATSALRFYESLGLVRASALVRHDGWVLLHRTQGDTFWTLPGGRVEFGVDLAERGHGLDVGLETRAAARIRAGDDQRRHRDARQEVLRRLVADDGADDRLVQRGVEGGEAGERGDLFAGEASELGHSNEKGDGGLEADAWDRDDQFEPASEVGTGLQGGDDAAEFGQSALLEGCDVGLDQFDQAWIVQVFAPGLQSSDVLTDLIDIGQVIGEADEIRVRFDRVRFDHFGGPGDDLGVEGVVLGATEAHAGEELDLHGLE